MDTYHKDTVQKENEWREKMDAHLLREQIWEQVMSCVLSMVILRYSLFIQECQGLHQKCRTKEAECQELTQQCGRALGRAAIARAESKAKDSLLEGEKTRSLDCHAHTHTHISVMSSQGEVRNRPSEEAVFQIQPSPAGKASVGMCCGGVEYVILPAA